jgi:hypothetical protein
VIKSLAKARSPLTPLQVSTGDFEFICLASKGDLESELKSQPDLMSRTGGDGLPGPGGPGGFNPA